MRKSTRFSVIQMENEVRNKGDRKGGWGGWGTGERGEGKGDRKGGWGEAREGTDREESIFCLVDNDRNGLYICVSCM